MKKLMIVGAAAMPCMLAWAQAPSMPPATTSPPAAPAAAMPSSAAVMPAATPAAAPKIEFAHVRSKVLPGDKIGHLEGGWFCINGRDMKASDSIERVFDSQAQFAFKKAAAALQLPLATREVSAFDTNGPSDADFRLGGVVESVDEQVCSYPQDNRKGKITIEVKWDLFSTRQQRVVASRSTTGIFTQEGFASMSAHDFESNAFVASMRSFFEDPEIKGLMAGGTVPVPAPAFAPLHLQSGAVVPGPTTQTAEALRGAVATISSDAGSGSAFYVADGYLLTDRHVVGSSRYVKVHLASGKDLVGEVLRADGPRDVALLKTDGTGSPSLRLQLADPPVGEDVWAIGSPLNQVLAGTMTRGVLSSTRVEEGVRFLQSDVAVNPGNSGGPLLDGQGNVLGLTQLKVANASGLAFFVPIRDALERLSLSVDPSGTTTTTTTTSVVTPVVH